MKLYSETLVEEMLMKARFHNSDDSETYSNEYLIAQYQCKAIELPSDEEIYNEAQMKKDNIKLLPFDMASFQFGVLWLRDKIQGDNK